MEYKIQKTSLVSSITTLELLALSSPFYRRSILVSVLTTTLKVLDTTKTDIFELKFSHLRGTENSEKIIAVHLSPVFRTL